MALTLTEERRVAWKIQGIGPDPVHTLVIFKKVGTGKILHKILPPGYVLKLGWRESADSYVAYAISNDENLRHSFSRKYQSLNQVKTFTLHFILEFAVSEAQDLALKLEGRDPLKSLEDEVASMLSTTARHLPWEEVRQESPNFGLRLLEAEATKGSGERRENFAYLQFFARSLGLDLRHVDITRSLTEVDIEVEVINEKIERQLGVEAAQTRLGVGREKLKHHELVVRTGLEWEREQLAIQRRQALEGIDRLRIVFDNLTKEGLRGFSQAVDGVRSFPAINDAFLEIRTIQASLMALSSGTNSMPTLGAAGNPVLSAAQAGPLLTEVRRPSDPLERLVAEAFQHLRILDGNPADKRRILATLLHLIAEAALGREGDEEYLEGCRESLERQLYPLDGALEEEQLKFLGRLRDIEKLRQDLG